MANLQVRAGDFFYVGPAPGEEPGFVTGLILFFSKLFARDRKAEVSHGGLIVSIDGMTLEATIKGTMTVGSIYDYTGKYVVITRIKWLRPIRVAKALEATEKEFGGEGYPFLKLLLFPFNIIARYCSFGRGVCSELMAFVKWQIGVRHQYWSGFTPAQLLAEDRINRKYTKKPVFEGIL